MLDTASLGTSECPGRAPRSPSVGAGRCGGRQRALTCSHGRDYQPRHSCERERERSRYRGRRAGGRPSLRALVGGAGGSARLAGNLPGARSRRGAGRGDEALWPCSDFLWQGKGSWPFWGGRQASRASRWLVHSGWRPGLPRGRLCPHLWTDLRSLPGESGTACLSLPSALALASALLLIALHRNGESPVLRRESHSAPPSRGQGPRRDTGHGSAWAGSPE